MTGLDAAHRERVHVKICGLRDVDTIRSMDGLAVDEIGIVFAPSKRQVSLEQAAKLMAEVRALRNDQGRVPRVVGVFVNPDLAELEQVMQAVRLDVIQLHGQETPEQCQAVKERFQTEVWKAISVNQNENETEAGAVHKQAQAQQEQAQQEQIALDRLKPYKGIIDAVLLDTAGGGTGQTFDWTVIGAFRKAAEMIGARLYVAGGLHPDNVEELLISHAPDGIDVSSGVETSGVKDLAKIRAFTGKVKRT